MVREVKDVAKEQLMQGLQDIWMEVHDTPLSDEDLLYMCDRINTAIVIVIVIVERANLIKKNNKKPPQLRVVKP